MPLILKGRVARIELSCLALLCTLAACACNSGDDKTQAAASAPSKSASAAPSSYIPSGDIGASVDAIARLTAAQNIDGLVGLARPQEVEGGIQPDDPAPLCAGATAGTRRQGFLVAQHGGHGAALDVQGLRQILASAAAGKPRLASFGCAPSAPGCPRLFVAFENPPGAAQRVFYIVAERDGPSSMRISGVGMSGDDATTILTGGGTMTPWGDARFTPYLSRP